MIVAKLAIGKALRQVAEQSVQPLHFVASSTKERRLRQKRAIWLLEWESCPTVP